MNPIATWPAIETELPKLVPGMTTCRVTKILEHPCRVHLELAGAYDEAVLGKVLTWYLPRTRFTVTAAGRT